MNVITYSKQKKNLHVKTKDGKFYVVWILPQLEKTTIKKGKKKKKRLETSSLPEVTEA